MIETQVNPLSSYFDEIVESCANDCELGLGYYDYDCYDSRSNGIYFENEEYMIEGSFDAAADHIEDGDGYWLPRTTIIKNASVSVTDLTGFKFNPETEDFDIELPDDELNKLSAYIEKQLPRYLND